MTWSTMLISGNGGAHGRSVCASKPVPAPAGGAVAAGGALFGDAAVAAGGAVSVRGC